MVAFRFVARVLAVLLLTSVLTEAAEAQVVGRVVSLRGSASVRRGGNLSTPATPLLRGATVHKGDVIRTTSGSAARLLMSDRSVLDVGPSSYITLSRYSVKKKERSVGVHVFVGSLWARVTKAYSGRKNYSVYSSNAVAGVRGTEFMFSVEKTGSTSVTCVKGGVDLEAQNGEVQRLDPMMQGSIGADGTSSQKTVTQTEVKKLESTVKSGGGLNPDKAEERVEQAGAKAEANENSGEKGSAASDGGEDGEDEDGDDESEEGDDGEAEGSEKDAADGEGEGGAADGPPQGEGGDGPPPPPNGPAIEIEPPTLELDPGAGQTRVKIRVEVEK